MFKQDDLEKLTPNHLIRKRSKRPEESEEKYQQYLSMFSEPIEKAASGGSKSK